jgi:hypothetical protein
MKASKIGAPNDVPKLIGLLMISESPCLSQSCFHTIPHCSTHRPPHLGRRTPHLGLLCRLPRSQAPHNDGQPPGGALH